VGNGKLAGCSPYASVRINDGEGAQGIEGQVFHPVSIIDQYWCPTEQA
jgi:hypothetical protein